MAIIKWEPFHDVSRFFEDDDLWGLPKSFRSSQSWDLSVDVYEEGNNVVAQMNLPGVDPDKLDIAIDDGYLRVTGSRDEDKEVKKRGYYSKQIMRGSFERTVRLPYDVDSNKANADYDKGVLTVLIPKRKESKGKKIKVTPKK